MEQILSHAVGPAGAVAVLCLVLYGLYNIAVKHLLPAHRDLLERIVDEHKEDREIFRECVQAISKRLSIIEGDIKEIKSTFTKGAGWK